MVRQDKTRQQDETRPDKRRHGQARQDLTLTLRNRYAESFKKNGTEFLVLVNPIDEMVMSNLEKYNDKDLVGADRSSIDLNKKVRVLCLPSFLTCLSSHTFLPCLVLCLGLAWLGLAWLGLAWLGLAWLGLAWLGLAWLGLSCVSYPP
jgi:hypothetical protein